MIEIKRITVLLCLLTLVFTSCNSSQEKWVSIFNGKNLDGWIPKFTKHPLGENYKNTFRVEDGNLVVSYENWEKFNGEFGHLFYSKKLSNYKLRIQYRFVGDQVTNGPGWAFRNSGIMLHGQDPKTMAVDQDFPVSIEAQILGGSGEGRRPTANVCSPGTHYVFKGELIKAHCKASKSKTFHGDQWVTMEVEVHGNDVIRHFINDELVFEYEGAQLDPKDKDAKKLIDSGVEVQLSGGYISLQAESHSIEFRSVELMEL